MRFFLSLILLWLPLISGAQELIVSGSYYGENLFVRNPFNRATGTFCATSVRVNGNLLLDDPQASAFTIDLSGLSQGQAVEVRVGHREGCKPIIVNPQVLREQSVPEFSFLSTSATNNSIEWIAQGDNKDGRYVIQQEVFDRDSTLVWRDLDEAFPLGGLLENRYAVRANNFPGENRYRIRYDGPGEPSVMSADIYYTSTRFPVTFSPFSVTTRITLSMPIDYEVTDRNGRLLISGFGQEVDCQDLKPGEYYLHIQNRIEKFVKK